MSKTFRLVRPQTVQVPASFAPPDGEAGKITLHLRYLSVSERRALIERLQDEGDPPTDAGLASEVVVGWAGLADEHGAEMAFSAAALDEVMDVPYVAKGVTDALIEHLFGERGKNFAPPVGNGQAAKPT